MGHCNICGMDIGAEGLAFHGYPCSELSISLATMFDLNPDDAEYHLLWVAALAGSVPSQVQSYRERLQAAALKYALSEGWVPPAAMRRLYANPGYQTSGITRITMCDPQNPGQDIVLYDLERDARNISPTTWFLSALPRVAASFDSAGL